MNKKMLLAALIAWAAHIGPASAACAPGTCCNENPTTGTPTCGQAAGNPLNVMSGNKFQREVDMPALPGVLGLELVRYYNSEAALDNYRGIMGRGWRLSYEAELAFDGQRITVHQGDGTQTRYEKAMIQWEPGVTVYNSNEPGVPSLRAQRVAGTLQYELPLANGNRQTFDAQGKLVRITAPTGEYVSLQRDVAGFLLRVTDPQGRFLSLRHLPPHEARTTTRFRGVQTIDTPVGRFTYSYGSAMPAGSTAKPDVLIANLVKVDLPTHYDASKKVNPLGASNDRGTTTSSVSRIYHYEDAKYPTLLTGITVKGQGSDGKVMNERIVTWGYDARGRANLSVKGSYDPKKPGPEQVTLEFHTKADGSGTTVLTNSLGQTTSYSYAQINGKALLLEVRGAGCATCGPVNVRHRYDIRGRLMESTQLDAKGQPVSAEVMEYDGIDRLRGVSEVRYRNGKAGAPRMLVRYVYGPDLMNRVPTVIARPSVVAGKEHLTTIEYNDKRQPVSVTESGFSPLDEKGEPSVNGTPISRTTRYTYAEINDRSVLSSIDGPLPNGPKGTPDDSDITRIQWDRQGSFIVRIEEPGARVSTIDYADSGQIARVRNAQGVQTQFEYETLGPLQKLSTVSPGWDTARAEIFKHDALGRLTEAGRQGGEADYRPRTALGWDVADRLKWRASSLGVLEQQRYDTESRVVETGRYSNAIAQAIRYEFDEQGRLASLSDRTGAAYRFSYTADNRMERVTDTFGEVWRAPSVPDTKSTRVAAPKKLVDDFGRIVAVISTDTGRTVREYDSADRMVGSQDALGNRARYEWDLQNRILRQTITDARTKQATQTQWRYEGAHLASLEHPQQSERYTYDVRGLRIGKTITLHTQQGERSSTTRYEYDAQGVLRATSLPDGSSIQYERNGQGQVVAMYRQRLQTSWLRWALPRELIVKDLQRDLVGIKSYVTGNGIEAQMQRSRAGILARVVYRNTHEPKLLTAEYVPGISSANAASLQPDPQNPKATAVNLPGATGAVRDPRALIDHRYLWDTSGDLLMRQDSAEQGLTAEGYAYDRSGRLIASASPAEFSRYAYDRLGRRVLAQQGAGDQSSMRGTIKIGYAGEDAYRWTNATAGAEKIKSEYDATGLPTRTGRRSYTWDALGRLLRIDEDGKMLASYSYNHRGERVAKSVATGSATFLYVDKHLAAEIDNTGLIRREYIYLADSPIAAIDAPSGLELAKDDAWSAFVHDVRTILTSPMDSDAPLVWLHTNHLGAPEAATDAHGRIVWQASYSPFGHARVKSDNFALSIRLPGQYEDAESGLYYNRQRYYDPDRGQYLSPDPMGTPNGPNSYAYANYNPLKYVDPDGLVLFAFDGTGNDESNPATLSNVVLFRNIYEDGNKYYITGPGTLDPATGIVNPTYKGGNTADVVGSLTGKERITAMIRYLNQESDLSEDEKALNIDLVGFSRGSAEARDFANQIVSATSNGYYQYKDDEGNAKCQKVNYRFMGLFDTVLSTHVGTYQLGIPDAFKYVAQAQALNEYRGGLVAFPSESIAGVSTPNGDVRIERGFLGAHSDIGGSFPEGDLAKVAMVWMVNQAKAAGVTMGKPNSTIISNPVLHDKSSNLLSGAPGGGPTETSEDRDVRFASGVIVKERHADIAGMSWTDTTKFITYKTNPNTSDYVSGTVDVREYLAWLNEHGYEINMTVE